MIRFWWNSYGDIELIIEAIGRRGDFKATYFNYDTNLNISAIGEATGHYLDAIRGSMDEAKAQIDEKLIKKYETTI